MPGPFAQLAVAALISGVPTSHDDGSIEIIDAGDPATAVRFVGIPDIGDTATVDMVQTVRGHVVETTQWLDEPRTDSTLSLSAHVRLTVEVIDADDGGFVLRGEVVDYSDRDRSDDAFIAAAYEALGAYETLVGESLDFSFDDDGALDWVDPAPGTSLDDEQEDALWDVFSPDLSSIVPDEEVGSGARWTISPPGDIELLCELTEIGDRYRIDASAVTDPALLTEVLGPVSGSGDVKFSAQYVVTGDPENPLDYQRTEDIDLAADFTSGSDSGSLRVSMTMRTTLTPD